MRRVRTVEVTELQFRTAGDVTAADVNDQVQPAGGRRILESEHSPVAAPVERWVGRPFTTSLVRFHSMRSKGTQDRRPYSCRPLCEVELRSGRNRTDRDGRSVECAHDPEN